MAQARQPAPTPASETATPQPAAATQIGYGTPFPHAGHPQSDYNDLPTSAEQSPGSDRLVRKFPRPGDKDSSPPEIEINTIDTGATIVRSAEGAGILCDRPGIVTLEVGEILVTARKETSVRVANCTIVLKPGSAALVSKNKKDEIVKVRNIYDAGVNSTEALIDKEQFKLLAGQEMIIGPSSSTLATVLQREPIGRRSIKYFDLRSHQSMTVCEVSLVSVCKNSEVLKRVTRSLDSSDRAISKKIEKMAACLYQATGQHGPYLRVQP